MSPAVRAGEAEFGAAVWRGSTRAVLLALGTGVCYGVIAALTKSVVSLVDDGVLALLASWERYALAVSAAVATLLQQSAFQAGDLGPSLPAVAVAVMVSATVVLARSAARSEPARV